MSQSSKPLEGFDTIGPRISLYRATDTGPESPSKTPSLIVLCTWMNAAKKHIAVYTTQYRERFPTSNILVIQSSTREVLSSPEAQTPRLAPLIPLMRSLLATTPGSVVLHAMSNGGAITAMQLAHLLPSSRTTQPLSASSNPDPTSSQPKIQFARVIFDCQPSRPRVAESARATVIGVPPTYFRRAIADLLARIFYILWRVWEIVRWQENGLMAMRRRLNEPGLLGDPETVERLYLYSEADAMVSWRDVRDHAAEARGVRVAAKVREVVFLKAAHCALPVENAGKYWTAVEDFLKGIF